MGYIGQFDQTVLNLVEKLPSALHPFMVFITNAGSPLSCAVVLLIISLWAYKHKQKRVAYTGLALLVTMPLANLLKELTRRVRPDTDYVHHMLFQTYSFPSGHAYASLLVFGYLIYLAKRHIRSSWKWPIITGSIIMIILVGISRVYLGAHFPSDVLGGWLLGFVVLTAITYFIYRKQPTKAKK